MIVELNSLSDTQKLASDMAKKAVSGQVILLKGNLGAGKSTFAREFIQALCGKDTNVPSPTFTIMQSYAASKFNIWHLDLYRIKDEKELEELGLSEIFANSVVLVEWPDIARNFFPASKIEINFSLISETKRQAEILP
jgi:tRNA threonylcarbamoyl adenosine modification protein YjeE